MKTTYPYGAWSGYLGHLILALCLGVIPLSPQKAQAQEPILTPIIDSILPIDLKEVIVISSFNRGIEHKSQPKPLSTLDQYLESSKKVS
ncbi:MAG: hypothetical protein VXW38_12060, partial [Bacteroidota bacterium]|nr:hypothetical protein [Bacteroidota bacterium]